MSLVTYKNADRPFRCTQAQADTLDRLSGLKKGCIGSVVGYRPTTGYVKGSTPIHNVQFISRFDYGKLNARKLKALESITFAECAEDIAKHAKLKALSTGDALEQFNASKAAAIESINTTAAGDRSDAHRQGHDRCYIHIAEGVKVNLDTVKGADGIKEPVLTDGLPTCEAILFSIIQLSKTVVQEGEYKVVNSGPKVLMDNIIKSKMNSRSVSYKTLSLKADNFTALNVDKQTIAPGDLQTVEVSKSKLIALLEACGFSDEAVAIMEALESEGAIS